MDKCAIYIRVSTGRQEELSPDAQKRLITEYAKKNKIIVDDAYIFIENGISGRHANKRPQFQKMISLAKTKPKPFDVILVWKFSRFARNQEESIVYKSLLKKQNNIDVISISEPLIEGPFGSLIERIIEWMDEYYSIRLAGEVKRGMVENAMRGGYQSPPPLGYISPGSMQVPVIVKEEAKAVQYIFDSYSNGADMTSIARSLNDMGYTSKKNNPFESRTVRYILENPFYIGKIRWNNAEHGSRILNDKEDIIIADGQHEPLIDLDTWNKTRQILSRKIRPYAPRALSGCKHWLSGLVKCSICGRSLCYSNHTFQCHGYTKGIHKGSQSISELKLIAVVLNEFDTTLKRGSVNFTHLQKHVDLGEVSTLKEQLKSLDKKYSRIKEAYINEIDNLEEYRDNKNKLDLKKQELTFKLNSLTSQANTSTNKDDEIEMLNRISKVYNSLLNDNVDYNSKGNMLRSIVDKIIFYKDNYSFEFFYYID